MLTPLYLANCSNDIVQLYSELEIEVLKDIARRIKATGIVSSSAQWQIKMMQESGALYSDIIEKVAKINNVAKSDIERLFEESSTKSAAFDNEIFKSVGLHAISNANSQILSTGINKTLGAIINMTKTTASAGQQQFINASTKAYMQVTSGAFDYNTAIANACKDVAKTGLQIIEYDSGATISLEAGIRRNLMTGINQTAQKITEYNCDELECDLVETSSHSGARPDHALWQGKIFSRSGKSKKYKDFITSTDYGTGAGLGGWNCRHSYYPYFEGDKPSRTKAELDKINNETVTYNGETLSRYDAEQQQRYNERNIRRWKKENAMLSEVGADNSFAKKKVKEWNVRAQDFTDKTGIPRQSAREKVFTSGGKRDIIKIQGEKNMIIDKFTPCLENARTGEIVQTSFSIATKSDLINLRGWNFDWMHPDLNKSEIYKLTLKNDDEIQGLVALTKFERDRAIYINIAESAPSNIGKSKQYSGIGGHLFAIAAKRSTDLGYGGYIFMDAKNIELVAHYRRTLGAVLLGRPHPYRMFVDEDAAQKLLKIYTFEEGK